MIDRPVIRFLLRAEVTVQSYALRRFADYWRVSRSYCEPSRRHWPEKWISGYHTIKRLKRAEEKRCAPPGETWRPYVSLGNPAPCGACFWRESTVSTGPCALLLIIVDPFRAAPNGVNNETLSFLNILKTSWMMFFAKKSQGFCEHGIAKLTERWRKVTKQNKVR